MNIKTDKLKLNMFSFLVLLTLSVLILTGCGSSGGGGGSGGGVTPVSINLNIPSAQGSLSARSSGVTTISGGLVSTNASEINSTNSVPSVIASIGIKISASDMADIVDVFNVSPGEAIEKNYDVPTGAARTIAVDAYNSVMGTGTVIYSGQTIVDLTGEATIIDIAMILKGINDAIILLNSGDVEGARDLLREIINEIGGDISDDADIANFFYALTRVLALLIEGDFVGANSGLSTVNDVVNAYGCTRNRSNPLNFNVDSGDANSAVPPDAGIICSGNFLSSGFPTGQELHNFINDVLRPEIDGAISNLNNVSESFNQTWVEHFSSTIQPVEVESDYGDVLVLRGILKAAIAGLLIIDAYDLNITIDSDILLTTIEMFLESNPGFPVLLDSNNLAEAKSYLTSSALDDLDAGIDWILGEEDDQLNDWINLVGMTALKIQEAKDDIQTARTCINGECTVDDNNTPADTSDDTVINIASYFDGQVDIHPFLPAFIGDDPVGFLPDPYFGGMLVRIKGFNPPILNNDEDFDVIADSLDKDIYYVYEGNSPPVDPFSMAFRDDPKTEGFFLIGAGSTSEGIVDFFGLVTFPYYFITSSSIEPTFVNRDVVRIDALEFIDTAGYCCDGTFQTSNGSLWSNLPNAPDGIPGELYEGDIIFVEDIIGGSGLRVYVMP